MPEGVWVPSCNRLGYRHREQLVVCAGPALKILRVLDGQLVTGASDRKVDTSGDQGPCSDVSLAAATLAGDEEPLNRCE